jgi:hypothetical protein
VNLLAPLQVVAILGAHWPHRGLGPAANRTAATLTVAGVAKRDRTDPITIDSIEVDTVVTVTPAHTRHTEEPNSLALGLALF